MSCHYRGINQKADQVREFIDKNPKAFSRADAELIKALYVPEKKMKALMDQDAERFKKAVEATGSKVSQSETIVTMALRYEADLDMPTVAAELSLTPEEFLDRLGRSELLARNFGSLKVEGGTVARQVLIQAFGDMVKELRLGILFQSTQIGQSLPDNTGEIDPLEGRTNVANHMVFTPDRRFALFASADKTVRLYDIDAGREIKRFVGHTHSVWCVAISPDGKRALSGSADNTLRLWNVETGREIKRLDGHTALVTAVAISPDGKRALSSSYDGSVIWWDLENQMELRRDPAPLKYVHCLAVGPDNRRALIGGDKALVLWDAKQGKELGRYEGHTDAVVCVTFSADGKKAISGSDDRTLRLWDVEEKRLIRTFTGHAGPVKSVCAFAEWQAHRIGKRRYDGAGLGHGNRQRNRPICQACRAGGERHFHRRRQGDAIGQQRLRGEGLELGESVRQVPARTLTKWPAALRGLRDADQRGWSPMIFCPLI